jgi:hypothetical protein
MYFIKNQHFKQKSSKEVKSPAYRTIAPHPTETTKGFAISRKAFCF